MLKKNVFLRTTKFKAPILQTQAKDILQSNCIQKKESGNVPIEESLISNQSSSTRTGSREKILSRHINTTFALSESQTSNSNKPENKILSKKNFQQLEICSVSDNYLKVQCCLDLKLKKSLSNEGNNKKCQEDKKKNDNGFLNHVQNQEITFQKDSSMKNSFEKAKGENIKDHVSEPEKTFSKILAQKLNNPGKKTGKFFIEKEAQFKEESKHKKIKSNDSSQKELNCVNEAYIKYGDLNKTSMIKKIMEDNAKLQEEATRSEEIISILIDAWNIQKEKIEMDKNKLLSKKIQVGFKNAEISSLTSKNNNSMLNLISIPKSSENTASHRMIYKKPTFDNKKEMNEPQISLVSNKMMKPRVLKSTTPYKSEKKQLNIKKLSEKEMHFEDINNFAVIYKYDDNEKNKLPSIKPMFNSGQISLNNTFNPLKSKIGIDIKELTFTDKKPVNNQSNLNLIVSAKMNPTITKQVININKANILTEYFPFDKTGSDKQLEKKSNQNNKTTKLEPLIYLEPAPKIFSEKSKSSSEKEPSSLQKNRFPKDVFCLNIPKKYIV